MTSKLGKKILEPAAWLSNLYYIIFVQNITYYNARKSVYISNFQGVDHDMSKHSTVPKEYKKNQDPNVDEFSQQVDCPDSGAFCS